MSTPQQRDRAEPMQARAFTGAWADVLSGVKAEVAALQGGWPVAGCMQHVHTTQACMLPMDYGYSVIHVCTTASCRASCTPKLSRAAAEDQRGGYDPVDMGLGLSGSMAQLTESPFATAAVFPGGAQKCCPINTLVSTQVNSISAAMSHATLSRQARLPRCRHRRPGHRSLHRAAAAADAGRCRPAPGAAGRARDPADAVQVRAGWTTGAQCDILLALAAHCTLDSHAVSHWTECC